MSRVEKLLPCPFCGGEAEIEREGTGRQSCIVNCTQCGCSLSSGETFNSGSTWNQRAGMFDGKASVHAIALTLRHDFGLLAPDSDEFRATMTTATQIWEHHVGPMRKAAQDAIDFVKDIVEDAGDDAPETVHSANLILERLKACGFTT